MDLFLFTNFFPFKRSEPFLINEFEFAKKSCKSITVLALYGNVDDCILEKSHQLNILPPVFCSGASKRTILWKGIANRAPFALHFNEFFSKSVFLNFKKLYWFIISFCFTRAALSAGSFKKMCEAIENSEQPVLYFYWGDNLAWIIPYLKKRIRNEKIKIVVRLHGSDLYEQIKGDYAPLREEIFEAADRLFTVSEHGKKYLVNKYPLFTSKIRQSSLGIRDHGVCANKAETIFKILSISNLVPLKRVHKIFEALQLLDFSLEWHHFGDGPLGENLKELSKNSRENVRIFLHGFMKNDRLIDELQNNYFDVFVNVSSSEGLPVSIMEAFSFGIPAIATNVGGTSELVDQYTGVLLASDFSVNDLARELTNFYSLSDDSIKIKRDAARSRFLAVANAEKNYPSFYTELKNL